MTDEERLRRLLKTAFPPSGDGGPSRDLWPAVVGRGENRPRFSAADVGAAAVVALVLLMFPEWFWFLAYQL